MRKFFSPAVWIALLFVLLGVPFLRLPGLHVDASSELACFYPCSLPVFRPTVWGYPVPIMVLSYLGAFKAWLYQPMLSYLEITAAVLRLPFLLVGAASVWMFFALLDRTIGRYGAIAGALLLATDASFVIVTTMDFGPVAFLHFFLLAGILLLLRFERTQSRRYLALAFLVFGVALWHKALFLWMLAGLGTASLAIFPRRVWSQVSPSRVALAAACLCLGAAPLVVYNAISGGETFRTGHVMSANTTAGQKLLVLRKTMDGSALLGFLTDENWKPGFVRTPIGRLARLSVRLSLAAGGLRSGWMLYGFALCVCLLPWLWFTGARKPAFFAVVYLVVVWCQMAIVPNTGGSIHHAILLWPFPHFLMAVAAAEVCRRFSRNGARAVAAALVLIAGCNLLLLNQYVAHLETGGTTAIFTDAIDPLSGYLAGLPPSNFFAIDWGYADTLCLLSDGEMSVQDISYPLQSGSDTELVRSWLTAPRAIFIGRAPGDEVFPGVHSRLDQAAGALGYTRRVLQVVQDRNHRPRFEVLQYLPGTVIRSTAPSRP